MLRRHRLEEHLVTDGSQSLIINITWYFPSQKNSTLEYLIKRFSWWFFDAVSRLINLSFLIHSIWLAYIQFQQILRFHQERFVYDSFATTYWELLCEAIGCFLKECFIKFLQFLLTLVFPFHSSKSNHSWHNTHPINTSNALQLASLLKRDS